MRLLLVIALMTSSVSAQTGLLVCQGFNEANAATTPYTVPGGESLAIQIIPTSDLLLGGVDFYATGILLPGGAVEVRREDPATALPGDPLTSGFATVGAGGPAWFPIFFNALIVLRAGQPYWVVLHTNASIPADLGTEPTGPDTQTWAVTSGGLYGPFQSGQFKLRTLSNPCVPPTAPAAAATPIGVGCTGLVGVPPGLVPVGAPELGSTTFRLRVLGPANTPVALYWALTPDASGTGLGSGCRLHLDVFEVLNTAALGLQPWFTGTITSAGTADFPHPLPAAVNAAGTRLVWQAVVFDPAGPPLGGSNLTLTNALEVLVGF